jgi:HlyD family secretion protein
MSTDVRAQDSSSRVTLEIPEDRHGLGWKTWTALATVLAAAACYGGWKAGLRPDRFLAAPTATLATLTVDEGEMAAVVTENGSLESADNASIKCMVEALIGMTGGATATGGKSGASGSKGGGGAAAAASPTKTASKARAGASTSASKGQAATGTGAGGSTASAGASSGGTSGGASSSGSGSSGASTTTTATKAVKPTIRSFSYSVAPYTPLRPAGTKSAQSVQRQGGLDPSMMGGGRGGRGGGGGMGGMQEKPGSTRIIKILDEGTKVKPGDVVCELDSSDFVTELQAQKIRYLQAKSWVVQVQSILEVNLISLKEYEEGIYPQDVQLIKQYLASCKIDEERARKNYTWSKDTAAKGFRSPTQVQADALALQQAEIALQEAEGMWERLDKYTSPRLKTNLRAKIEAIKSDKLSQEASFQLEVDRLKRLEKAVANCTLRAPREGIVVYFQAANMWGRSDNQIREGVTVREGQTIIQLPDPKHMRVRARINESKVALIVSGQKALITVDAFPDRPMMGTVGEVTPIPSGAAGPISDVKIYYATVNIDSGGFEDLRPGLSAEVSFLIDAQRKVTRVPLQTIRWVNSQAFVAVARPQPTPGAPWEWRNVTLGRSDRSYAEVVTGLQPGDRVVAHPDKLPAPRLTRPATQGPAVAEAPARPRA